MTQASRAPRRKKKVKTQAVFQDRATDMAGVTLRTVGKKPWIIVQLSQAPGVDGLTLEEVGRKFRLNSQAVLAALLDQPLNVRAVRALYDHVRVSGTHDNPQNKDHWPPFRSAAAARRTLKRIAFARQGVMTDGGGSTRRAEQGVWTAYERWRLDSTHGLRAFALPLSKDFEAELKDLSAWRARQLKARELEKPFYRLEEQLIALRKAAAALRESNEAYVEATEEPLKAIVLLTAIENMLEIVTKFPGPHRAADLEKYAEKNRLAKDAVAEARQLQRNDLEWTAILNGRVRGLKQLCLEHMVHKPVHGWAASAQREREQRADALLKLLEDRSLLENVLLARKHRDFLPSYLWQDLGEDLTASGLALLHSPRADRFIAVHLDTMIDQVAGQPLDLSGISAPDVKGFDQALRSIQAPSSYTSPLQAFASAADKGNLLIGNLPGPSSVAVVLVKAALAHMVQRIAPTGVAVAGSGGRLSARLYRFVSNAADLDMSERLKLVRTINTGNFDHVKDIEWDKKFQNGQVWGGVLAIVSAVSLYAAITDDQATTMERVTRVISSGAGTLLGVGLAFERVSTLAKKGVGYWGNSIGVVAALAGTFSAAAAALEAWQQDDPISKGLATSALAGSVLSVVGFLHAASAASAMTGFGVPLGVVLEALGLVIALSTALADYLAGVRTTGSEALLKALLEEFDKSYHYRQAKAKVKALADARRSIQEHVGDSWYMDVPYAEATVEVVQMLIDMGFSDRHIATIVNEKQVWVHKNKGDRQLSWT